MSGYVAEENPIGGAASELTCGGRLCPIDFILGGDGPLSVQTPDFRRF
ncbi:hypothetical protein [Crateriforma conspicua]|nr:hypothetical protein [Crateriforma conspicua]